MNLKIAFILIMYWTIWILIMTIGVSDGSNIFVNNNYNMTGQMNSSGFSTSEIDTGGIFAFFDAIFTSLGRFIGLIFFGLTPALSGLSQLIVSAWNTAITLYTIAFIISSIWNG